MSDRVVLVTSNIEAERIASEELAGLGKIQVFAKPWFWDDSAHLNRQAKPSRVHCSPKLGGLVLTVHDYRLKFTDYSCCVSFTCSVGRLVMVGRGWKKERGRNPLCGPTAHAPALVEIPLTAVVC